MTRRTAIRHEFVEFIPEHLEDGIVYVSIPYATVVHLCCCGCGNEVVTPLSPAQWSLLYDGRTVSLDWSVGNWTFPCESHYWIDRDRVVWAPRWSKKRIALGRASDRRALDRLYAGLDPDDDGARGADREEDTHPDGDDTAPAND